MLMEGRWCGSADVLGQSSSPPFPKHGPEIAAAQPNVALAEPCLTSVSKMELLIPGSRWCCPHSLMTLSPTHHCYRLHFSSGPHSLLTQQSLTRRHGSIPEAMLGNCSHMTNRHTVCTFPSRWHFLSPPYCLYLLSSPTVLWDVQACAAEYFKGTILKCHPLTLLISNKARCLHRSIASSK